MFAMGQITAINQRCLRGVRYHVDYRVVIAMGANHGNYSVYVKWRVVSRGLSRGVRNGANHGNYSVYVKWREVFAMGHITAIIQGM